MFKKVAKNRIVKPLVTALLVAVFSMNLPVEVFAAAGVSITANGQDNAVTIQNGTTFTLAVTSTDVTACQLTTPAQTGITLTMNDSIAPGHAWYPAVGGSTTFTVSCTDGVSSVTDSVTVSIASTGGPATTTPATLSVDIQANGSNGPVTINNGDSFTYTWTSTGATACQLTAPAQTGVTLAGSDTVASSHQWYPRVGTPTTLTISCTNGTSSVTDSVVVQLAGSTGGGSLSVDIKARGSRDSAYSDGPVTIQQGDTYTYTWTSSGATACQLTSPAQTGVTLAGTDGPIDQNHAWYPKLNAPTTLTISCTNGTSSVTDSVVINVAQPSVPPTGGSGGGRRTATVNPGQVLGAATSNFCPFLTQYMRIGYNNDRQQVIKLQAFLHASGYSYVSLTGVFDQATDRAVRAFQQQYASEILTPWGINQPTGYVYIRTLGKINQILCNTAIPAVHPTIQKVVKPAPAVISKEGAPKSKEGCKCGDQSTAAVPTVGYDSTGTTTAVTDTTVSGSVKGQGIAASLLSTPKGTADILQHIYEFLLILIVLYILGSIVESVLYKDVPENVRKRFLAKWITFAAGLVLAIVASLLLGANALVLPLLIALIATIIWLLTVKRNVWRVTTTTTTKSA